MRVFLIYDDDWIRKNYEPSESFRDFWKRYNAAHNDNPIEKYPTFVGHVKSRIAVEPKGFTEEQKEWLRNNVGCKYEELTKKFNAKFGTNYQYEVRGYSPIERLCYRMGLNRYVTNYGYTDAENEWLLKYGARYSNHWLSEHIETISGYKHSEDSIKFHLRENLNIRKGSGGIREDTIQTYKRPIGSICSWKGRATTRIKLRDTGDEKIDWYPYGRYVYEQYYGVKLPSNLQVIHLDGNKTNFDIENLCAVSHEEHAILAINDWHGKGEITRTAIEYAKLRILLRERGIKFGRKADEILQ